LQLYKRYNCRLQVGGDDQWGNIVSGIELIRRIEGAECYGLTFPLVTTSDGKKMGKTEKGALFLDPAMTSPYEFFQYFRNAADADVLRFLLMFTFLPVEECRRLGSLKDAALNEAKERLAWESHPSSTGGRRPTRPSRLHALRLGEKEMRHSSLRPKSTLYGWKRVSECSTFS